jgi:hypothetical protein
MSHLHWHGGACEHWILLRAPLSERTIAANVLKHGVGALNIDGCRVPLAADDELRAGIGGGRWPANVTTDGSECVLAALPQTYHASGPASGPTYSGPSKSPCMAGPFCGNGDKPPVYYGDLGSVARFYYCAKPTVAERDFGLHDASAPDATATRLNTHPTVKPLALMRHLVKLITPANGTVLDMFMGSGTTGMAAVHEGFSFIGIDQNKDYVEMARKRILAVTKALAD